MLTRDEIARVFARMGGGSRDLAADTLPPSRQMPFEPERWASAGIRELTNCLTYALNEPRLGQAIPGTLAQAEEPEGMDPAAYDPGGPEKFKEVLRSMGLIEVDDPFSREMDEAHLIAFAYGMAANKGNPDFHVWRMDKSGGWSHKPGNGMPTDKDENDCPIPDPQYADRGRYDIFAGYWRLPEEGLKVRYRMEAPAVPARSDRRPGF